jgi:hypothetical protein
MISKYRKLFNAHLRTKNIRNLKRHCLTGYAPTFRLRNTIFISNELKSQLIEGCNEVIALIQNKDFKALTTNH